jgi:hypothetical protein
MSEPLDLRAVGEKLNVLDSDPNGVLTLADEKALLTALRETRAALAKFIAWYMDDEQALFHSIRPCIETARAALEYVQDGGPPSEGPK